MNTIHIYTKPRCPQCKMTQVRFGDQDNIVLHDTSVPEIREALLTKYPTVKAMPFVIVEDSLGEYVDSWAGFRPEKVDQYK